MMHSFFRWVSKKITEANRYEEEMQPGVAISLNKTPRVRAGRVGESDALSTEPITFKMFKASGGWAIEFKQYDSKSDRIDTSLYVVNGEEELGKHVSQIITMEALKR